MDNTERKITARRNWLKIYKKTRSVTETALRCGIARSTLYRWLKRSENGSEPELSDKSHCPKSLTNKKITTELETLILDIREKRKWGAARISTYLLRTKKIELSPMTIWRVLKAHNVKQVATPSIDNNKFICLSNSSIARISSFISAIIAFIATSSSPIRFSSRFAFLIFKLSLGLSQIGSVKHQFSSSCLRRSICSVGR